MIYLNNIIRRITKGEKIDNGEFENEFREKLGVSYQRLKIVVLSFYRSQQWVDVCYAYAGSFDESVPMELKPILRAKQSSDLLSKPINYENIIEYTKWKYRDKPVDENLTKILLKDLNQQKYSTLREIDNIIRLTEEAVKAYDRENHAWFEYGTDYITKSLGFADIIRGKHGFAQKTKDAFQKIRIFSKEITLK